MTKLAEMLGNAKRMDLYRMSNKENVPSRGKKKHHSQMSNYEKNFLFSQLKSFAKWSVSNHAVNRMEEKGINVTYDDIVSTIYNSNIIEYHVTNQKDGKDERVLLRSKAVLNLKYNLHVVFSITNGRVISVWLNRVNDTHSTIDMRDYSKSVKIIGMK